MIVAVALGLALGIQAFIIKPYRIPSGSMEPTLAVGQRVLVDRIGTHFSKPHVGEIAVFHPPKEAQREVCGPTPHVVKLGAAACAEPEPVKSSVNFIKRVVAGPGDTSTLRKVTSIASPPVRASSSASRTPTSANVARARSATFRRRSRFPPVTGS